MRWLTLLVVAATAAGLSQVRAETLPLPASVISFDSDEGEALLIGAEARNDFFPLSSHFTNQINPAFCGPASISMVLNALDVPRPPSDLTLGLGLFDQENIFTPATEAVKPQASDPRRRHDARPARRHPRHPRSQGRCPSRRGFECRRLPQGRDREPSATRITSSWSTTSRKAIGQEKGGHISPLAAYDADTDRFLILDVSRYKYPPVWVEAAALFGAMNTPDSDNDDKTRGYAARQQVAGRPTALPRDRPLHRRDRAERERRDGQRRIGGRRGREHGGAEDEQVRVVVAAEVARRPPRSSGRRPSAPCR